MQHRLTCGPVARIAAAAGAGGLALAALAACGAGGGPVGAAARPSGTLAAAAKHHTTQPTCPLTGVPATKPAEAAAPVLAVKVDNVAEAMPQAGLDAADLVVEEQVEGGLTRLFAAFECTPATNVGPIRSARDTDANLLTLFHGSVFAFSGANGSVLADITAHAGTTQVIWGSTPSLFRIDSSRPAPHDVFGSSTTLLHAGTSRRAAAKEPALKAPPELFSYGPMVGHHPKVAKAAMSWPAASATWTWTGRTWDRTQDGSPDTLAGGLRVSATNVIVLGVQLTYNGLHDVLGNASPDDVVVGAGKAWVLRNGRVITGTWSRKTSSDPWTLRSKGKVIDLAPGRTWVELLGDPGTFTTSK